MKADKNFKLSKSIKRLLAGFTDNHARGKFKDMMIRAEMEESRRSPPKERGSKQESAD